MQPAYVAGCLAGGGGSRVKSQDVELSPKLSIAESLRTQVPPIAMATIQPRLNSKAIPRNFTTRFDRPPQYDKV